MLIRALFLSVTVILVGCSGGDFVRYQSQAFAPRKAFGQYSEMIQLKCPNPSDALNRLAVIVAADSGGGRDDVYVLLAPIAPGRGSARNPGLRNYDLRLAPVLESKDVREVIDRLKNMVESWKMSVPSDRGRFSTYMVTPEHQEVALTDSVTQVLPSFTLSTAKVEDDSYVEIAIQANGYRKEYVYDDLDDVECLIVQLRHALDILEGRKNMN